MVIYYAVSVASKPKTWSGSPKESHGGCRCRWERADLQDRDAGLAKRSLTQRLSMAFCRFLPSLGNHPDILKNGAGENWNLSQSLRFGIWSLGCPRYPGGICHGHRARTQLFSFRKWSCLKIQDLRISWFYNQFPNEIPRNWQTQTTRLPLAGSAESWLGGGTRAWTWSGVGWLRGFSILDVHTLW